MTSYLLDANVLIALSVEEHDHHDRVSRWASGVDRFALCPIAEGALIRYLIRIGEQLATATGLLTQMHAMPQVDFWQDSISYAEADLSRVRGHAQVTDAYLVGLAGAKGGILATLDEGLAQEWPESTLLLPA